MKPIVIENPLPALQIQIPPQQRMDIYAPPPPPILPQKEDLERDIRFVKEALAYIESKKYREECHLSKDQIQRQISFYTTRFRELLMRRHLARGEATLVAHSMM